MTDGVPEIAGVPETGWRKSSFSDAHQGCVEVCDTTDGGRWVRDTKDRTKPAHFFTAHEWHCFVQGVKSGEFD